MTKPIFNSPLDRHNILKLKGTTINTEFMSSKHFIIRVKLNQLYRLSEYGAEKNIDAGLKQKRIAAISAFLWSRKTILPSSYKAFAALAKKNTLIVTPMNSDNARIDKNGTILINKYLTILMHNGYRG